MKWPEESSPIPLILSYDFYNAVLLIDDLPSFERHKAFEIDSCNNKDRTINLHTQPSADIIGKFTLFLSMKCLSLYIYCFSIQNISETLNMPQNWVETIPECFPEQNIWIEGQTEKEEATGTWIK
jgi:hypothetical protein